MLNINREVNRVNYCKCGKKWNRSCAFYSLESVNSYESNTSIDELMNKDHPSKFFYMTPSERKLYITSGASQIKSSLVHGCLLPTAPPYDQIKININ